MSAPVISLFMLFAFFLLEYATFFEVRQRWGTLWALVAANVVGFVFGGAMMVPLSHLGILDLAATVGY